VLNLSCVYSQPLKLVAWLSGNALMSINEVTRRRARLVLEWVTDLLASKPSSYVASHLDQLSLLPSAVGRQSEYLPLKVVLLLVKQKLHE